MPTKLTSLLLFITIACADANEASVVGVEQDVVDDTFSAPPQDVTPNTKEAVDRTVTLAPPANGIQLVTPPYTVPPATEVDICTVVRIEAKNGERFIWADRLESLVSQGTHHMNIFIGQFSFLDGYLGAGASEAALGKPAGQYPCADLDVMETAFPIFPSQRENQHIAMPEGVAIPMPLPLVLIASHHYINPTPNPVTINAALNMESVDASAVQHVAGLVFDTADTDIPPGTRKVEQATCIFERDAEVVLVSTHNHEWTECATLSRYDGQSGAIEPTPFYVNRNWDQPPILNFGVGEYSLSAGDGVHFACHHHNYTANTLQNDGTAEGEMCVFAAVTYPLPFTVSEIETLLSGTDLSPLLDFMGLALGPCDRLEKSTSSPWPYGPRTEGKSTCDGLIQTQATP